MKMPRPQKQTSEIINDVINDHLEEIREHQKGVVNQILFQLQERNITITKSAVWNRIHKYRVAHGLPVSKHTRRNIPDSIFEHVQHKEEPNEELSE